MAEIAWEKVPPWDRSRFGGWWWVGGTVLLNLFVLNGSITEGPGSSPTIWLVLGALAVICPVVSREVGRWFLLGEVGGDWRFLGMVAWRGLCFVVAVLPMWPGMPLLRSLGR